jgi:glycerol uptake facilitator protein
MSPNLFQRLSSEALGTLILVYFGSPPRSWRLEGPSAWPAPTVWRSPLAIWIFRATSGAHLNPAVTISLAVRGRFAWLDVPGYLIA